MMINKKYVQSKILTHKKKNETKIFTIRFIKKRFEIINFYTKL